mmetsp:Transcript_25704/g.58692  ORF Transcript_25704/g.58692 Transcript_25704/m.58692 type:complete len:627 (-) Transcript_25704:372-2252(-)
MIAPPTFRRRRAVTTFSCQVRSARAFPRLSHRWMPRLARPCAAFSSRIPVLHWRTARASVMFCMRARALRKVPTTRMWSATFPRHLLKADPRAMWVQRRTTFASTLWARFCSWTLLTHLFIAPPMVLLVQCLTIFCATFRIEMCSWTLSRQRATAIAKPRCIISRIVCLADARRVSRSAMAACHVSKASAAVRFIHLARPFFWRWRRRLAFFASPAHFSQASVVVRLSQRPRPFKILVLCSFSTFTTSIHVDRALERAELNHLARPLSSFRLSSFASWTAEVHCSMAAPRAPLSHRPSPFFTRRFISCCSRVCSVQSAIALSIAPLRQRATTRSADVRSRCCSRKCSFHRPSATAVPWCCHLRMATLTRARRACRSAVNSSHLVIAWEKVPWFQRASTRRTAAFFSPFSACCSSHWLNAFATPRLVILRMATRRAWRRCARIEACSRHVLKGMLYSILRHLFIMRRAAEFWCQLSISLSCVASSSLDSLSRRSICEFVTSVSNMRRCSSITLIWLSLRAIKRLISSFRASPSTVWVASLAWASIRSFESLSRCSSTGPTRRMKLSSFCMVALSLVLYSSTTLSPVETLRERVALCWSSSFISRFAAWKSTCLRCSRAALSPSLPWR